MLTPGCSREWDRFELHVTLPNGLFVASFHRRVQRLVAAQLVGKRQVFRRGSSGHSAPFVDGFILVVPVRTDATESVRGRPRTTRGGGPAVGRTAMTPTPMGPHWPGHSPPRETNESSPGVSPVPSECGLEPKGVDRPNPMVGFHVLQGVEEVNPVDSVNYSISECEPSAR
jgi:hypothetical protein